MASKAGSERVVKSAVLLAQCSLAKPSPDGCGWCGATLPARRRTWCSDRCGDTFWRNHWWSLARRAAKRRDKYRCTQCGHALPKRPSRAAFSSEISYKSATRTWRSQRKSARLEVNHIEPCLGQHGVLSCAHHLENLATLCVACHQALTLEAARKRRAS